jgi:predicted DNA repair protein MutK
MSAGFLSVLNQALAMSKRATVRTLGIVGDDLAINAKQLSGGESDRELPMVYAVAKGSLKNKAILIPSALLLGVTFPALIMPLLTIGGAYLCYEGVEKFLHRKDPEHPEKTEHEVKDHAAWEKRRVKKAIKTDLILSAEITAVSLWTVAAAPFLVQAAAMISAGIAMTAVVYGFVGGILKLDDLGAKMMSKTGDGFLAKARRSIGKAILKAAPRLVKTIGVIGTVAMFVVGGGMVLHGIPGGEHLLTGALNAISSNALIQGAVTMVAETAAGVLAGFVSVPVMKVLTPLLSKTRDFGRKIFSGLKKKKPAVVVKAEQTSEPSPEALKNVTDVKNALNTAAQPTVSDSQAPEIKPGKDNDLKIK